MIYQDERSVKWYKQSRTVKIILFSILLLISIVVFCVVKRPATLNDLSGGIYPETFRTTHRPLQKELLLLQKEGVFDTPPSTRMIPGEFSLWYASLETLKVLSGISFNPAQYKVLIKKSLQDGLQQKTLFFADPLENPVPGDLFRTLVWCFDYELGIQDYEKCAETLEMMFCYSSLLLNSNAADIYFLSKSMECAQLYDQTFQKDQSAVKLWDGKKAEIQKNYLFMADGLYRIERLRRMQDFEMIRVNGIRIFDQKIKGSSQMKEGLGTGSFARIKEGISTAVTDFFYDVDRDQTLTLSMLRKLLNEGISPYMLENPDRKISIHCYRKIIQDAGVFSSVQEYLGKSPE